MQEPSQEREVYREYRRGIETNELVRAIKTAALLFIGVQTLVFVPADWILYPDHFREFFIARQIENALLLFVYFRLAEKHSVAATAFTATTGSLLFLFMVQRTGGVESGYYVGIILLLVGMAVISPLSGKQCSLIAGAMCASYAGLPLLSDSSVQTDWRAYAQHLFFLGSACLEASIACVLIDKMRFRDFTQRRELIHARDELAAMDKAKSRFSANVHHELRTPLTLILSPLDALRSGEFGEVPESINTILDTMHSNGRRLHKMINNLLDLSKLESAQFSIRRRPTRVDRLVAELVSGAIPLSERKEVRLEHAGFENALELAIDPEAIEKVLMNLIGNALKFTDRGGSIRIEGVRNEDGLTISVKDTGIGIPADQIDSVFDRFAQVDSSTTRKYEGTGIGLSLAQEMVQLHEGRIWAESEGEGLGTTMFVWLPNGLNDIGIEEDVFSDDSGNTMGLAESVSAIEADLNLELVEDEDESLDQIGRQLGREAEANGPAPSATEETDAAERLDLPEILIAEDNPDMRQLLKTLVGRHYRVRTARNGHEALEMARASAPDLILSDVMMPIMDGTELCHQIKSNPETASIPIVLVTSKAENEMKVEGLERGADDYVTKPFHPRELLARVGSLVRSSVLRQQLAHKNTELGTALSELKKAEALLVKNERLAAVGELAAGIAHEVNNPVNFSLNAARMLATNANEVSAIVDRLDIDAGAGSNDTRAPNLDELSADISELAGIVTQGLERTHRLISDLRNFADPKPEVLPRRPADPGMILVSAANLIRPTFSQNSVDLQVDIAPELPEIAADDDAIGQVLLNLLKNACDASAHEAGSVAASVYVEGDSLVYEVSDNGTGIEQEVMDRIFEPFFTTKNPGEGTGLGLAISHRIVTNHAGTLTVGNNEGDRGATFKVTLPLHAEAGGAE